MAEAVESFANISAQDLLKHAYSCHGWVRKTTGLNKILRGWSRRFMILYTGYLYLYEDSEDNNFCEKILLKEYRVCDAQEVNKYRWAFKLIHESYGGKTLYFAVDSALDLKKWEEVITEEKDIYWPVLAQVDRTQESQEYDDLAAPRAPERNPCQRPPAPRPEPEPIYVNVNPPPYSSTTSTTVPTSPTLPLVRAPKSRPGPSVSESHNEPKIIKPPIHPRPKVPPVQLRPHSSASRPLNEHKTTQPALSLRRALVPGRQYEPKPKESATLPCPVPKAPHGRPIATPSPSRLPRSSSETCLKMPGFDDVMKQLADLPTSSRPTSPAGVSTPRKPRGRGAPDGLSFKEKHREMATPSVVSSTFRHDMDRTEAESALQNKYGVYILRNSQKAQSGLALSVCTEDGVIHHQIFYEEKQGYALSSGGRRFRKIVDLLENYYESYLPYR
ncbi:uncharacterized protein LOC144639205 isoform X2 [Oculina patagonica]